MYYNMCILIYSFVTISVCVWSEEVGHTYIIHVGCTVLLILHSEPICCNAELDLEGLLYSTFG